MGIMAGQQRSWDFPWSAAACSWSLDFTLALTFIALVIPALKDRATVLVAVAAGITAVLMANLPYKLGLLTAALVGIAVGMWSDKR